jgi:hypothetical protein
MSRWSDSDDTQWFEGPQGIDLGPRAEDLPEPIPHLREQMDSERANRQTQDCSACGRPTSPMWPVCLDCWQKQLKAREHAREGVA